MAKGKDRALYIVIAILAIALIAVSYYSSTQSARLLYVTPFYNQHVSDQNALNDLANTTFRQVILTSGVNFTIVANSSYPIAEFYLPPGVQSVSITGAYISSNSNASTQIINIIPDSEYYELSMYQIIHPISNFPNIFNFGQGSLYIPSYNGRGGVGLPASHGIGVSVGQGNSFEMDSTLTLTGFPASWLAQGSSRGYVLVSNSPYRTNDTFNASGSDLLAYPDGIYFLVFTNAVQQGKNVTITVTKNITVSYSGKNVGSLCYTSTAASFC